MNYSVIIPLFNEEYNILSLHNEIVDVLENLSNSRSFEIIYIDDGSTDKTFSKLLEIKKKKFSVKIIKNKFNYSQSVSIFHGISNSNYDNLVFLDGDGQNNPKDISEMINLFEQGFDLIHGYRINRKDNFFSKTIPSIIANYLVRLFSNSKIKDHGCSLKVIKKNLLDQSILWGDFHRLLAARLSYKNLKIKQVATNHRVRKYGNSNYGFFRIFKVFIDLIYLNLFHQSKLKIFYKIGVLGLTSLFMSILSFVYMLFLKIIKNVSFIETPLPTVTVLFFITSLIFFSLMFIIQILDDIKNKLNHQEKNYDIFEI